MQLSDHLYTKKLEFASKQRPLTYWDPNGVIHPQGPRPSSSDPEGLNPAEDGTSDIMDSKSTVAVSYGPVCNRLGLRQAKKELRTCTKCAYSNHPAHAQSIIRVFALHSYIL